MTERSELVLYAKQKGLKQFGDKVNKEGARIPGVPLGL